MESKLETKSRSRRHRLNLKGACCGFAKGNRTRFKVNRCRFCRRDREALDGAFGRGGINGDGRAGQCRLGADAVRVIT